MAGIVFPKARIWNAGGIPFKAWQRPHLYGMSVLFI